MPKIPGKHRGFHVWAAVLLIALATHDVGQAEPEWRSCALKLTADDARATAVFVRHGDPNEFYLIAAYHAIHEHSDIKLQTETNRTTVKLTELVAAKDPFYADPKRDLAVFRLSGEGKRRLELEYNRVALPFVAICPAGAQARAVGNPKLVIENKTSYPDNYVAQTGIGACTTPRKILPSRYFKDDAAYVEILLLEELRVSRGFSGGPVLVHEDGSGGYSQKIAGIVQGGISNQCVSWAISAVEIGNSITDALSKNEFSDFPPSAWEKLMYNLEDSYAGTEADFWQIVDVSPSILVNGKRNITLEAGKRENLQLTIRANTSGSTVVATLTPENWFEAKKSPEPVSLKGNDLPKFEYQIVPSWDSQETDTLEFKLNTGEQTNEYVLTLIARVQDPRRRSTVLSAGPFGVALAENAEGNNEKFAFGAMALEVRRFSIPLVEFYPYIEFGGLRWTTEKSYETLEGVDPILFTDKNDLYFVKLGLRRWWTIHGRYTWDIGGGIGASWEQDMEPGFIFGIDAGLAARLYWKIDGFFSVGYSRFTVTENEIEFDFLGGAEEYPVDRDVDALMLGFGLRLSLH
jgi:hypothetical protein